MGSQATDPWTKSGWMQRLKQGFSHVYTMREREKKKKKSKEDYTKSLTLTTISKVLLEYRLSLIIFNLGFSQQ